MTRVINFDKSFKYTVPVSIVIIIAGLIDQHVHPVLAAVTLTLEIIAIEDWVLPGGTAKAALNALTVKLAAAVSGDVKVNAAHPGWVRTRMGGPASFRSPAARSAQDAAHGIVWLATLSSRGPNGGFFRDHRRIPW